MKREGSKGYSVGKDPGPTCLLCALMLDVLSSVCLCGELRVVMGGEPDL